MKPELFNNPALTVSLALAAGMLAQSAARHLRVPGIVLLLGTGVVLGPELLGVIRPGSLGTTLHTLVGFAVAVILFEGGMNLQLKRLRREARSIRQLVTVGALVTATGGALAARLFLGWPWMVSVLFGSLVIVTGPTVITPLLRRIRVSAKVATVLEAEGVLIDAVGAIVAVVALEIAVGPMENSLAFGARELAVRLGFGILIGLVGGLLIALLLRVRHLVPERLENVFTLAMVMALFQVSNALLHESGIVAVTAAGLVVGNIRTSALQELREFKEQITVMLIGMLFVLLAADVRLEHIRSVGMAGVWTVLALMFVVRPLNILVGTYGTTLNLREKSFLAWLAPRGIVAAAVASLFARRLQDAGIEGGDDLQALVFMVIAVTVLVQGLTGGLVAGMLGLRLSTDSGFVILGANDLGRTLARLLRDGGEEVVLIDSNQDACRAAEDEDFRVLHGSGLSESVMMRAGMDGRAGCVAVTSNDAVNLLFAKKALSEFRVPRAWVALRRGHLSVNVEMVADAGAEVLFGWPRNLDLWALRLERGMSDIECWRRMVNDKPEQEEIDTMRKEFENILLPVAIRRGRKTFPFDEGSNVREGDDLFVAVFTERKDEAHAWLAGHGWEMQPCPSSD